MNKRKPSDGKKEAKKGAPAAPLSHQRRFDQLLDDAILGVPTSKRKK